MKRIDGIGARPNVNGVGKTGFHDNADLPNQDATHLTPDWLNTVQEELANVIEGFGGNLEPNQKDQVFKVVKGIADRTALIEEFIENIVDYFLPVDTIISSFDPDFNPNIKYFGTTWILHGQGRVPVGLSTLETDADWKKTVGNEFGSDTHTLIIDETPSHLHSEAPFNKFASRAGDFPSANKTATSLDYTESEMNISDITVEEWDQATEKAVGGNQPHNNVQPSIIEARWRRIA